MKKYKFLIVHSLFVSLFFVSETIAQTSESFSLKCTSDEKVFTIVTVNNSKAKVIQEKYSWDTHFYDPIVVDKFKINNASIEIEYTEISY